MLPANTTIAEALWTGIAAASFLVNGALLWIALGDLLDLHRRKCNGAKRIAAWTAVGVKGVLTLVQCIFLGLGLFLARRPPTNPGRPVSELAIVVSSGLIAAALLLAGLGVFMHVRRMQLLDYLAGEEAKVARYEEVIEELHHISIVTEATNDEARAGKREAAAAHAKGQEVLDTIEQYTRPKPAEEGRGKHERVD